METDTVPNLFRDLLQNGSGKVFQSRISRDQEVGYRHTQLQAWSCIHLWTTIPHRLWALAWAGTFPNLLAVPAHTNTEPLRSDPCSIASSGWHKIYVCIYYVYTIMMALVVISIWGSSDMVSKKPQVPGENAQSVVIYNDSWCGYLCKYPTSTRPKCPVCSFYQQLLGRVLVAVQIFKRL